MEKVLIVEDDEGAVQIWTSGLAKEGFETLKAHSLEEGKRLFNANPDVVLVVMDACVPGHKPNTMLLVEMIRESSSAPIIACSSSDEYQQVLMESGCTHSADKAEVLDLAVRILGGLVRKEEVVA